jgi:hypothetical protein
VLLILTILAWQVRAIDAKALPSESDAVTQQHTSLGAMETKPLASANLYGY